MGPARSSGAGRRSSAHRPGSLPYQVGIRSTVERAKHTEPYGYLLKPIRPLDLRCCLELALHQVRAERERPGATTGAARSSHPGDERTKRISLLSAREVEVLTLVARGHTSKDIARALCIAKPTVDTYRSRLIEKLGVKSRTDIVSVASKAGLLEGPSDLQAPK